MRDGAVRALSQLHRGLYRTTRGRIGRRLPRIEAPMLLLTTTGRRSGRPHTVPLLYLEEGGGWLVIASYGGRNRHPAWYLNLVAEPGCEAQIGGSRIPVRATTVGPEARARLWPKVVTAYEGYRAYQATTEREIPLVLLAARSS